MAKKKKKKDLLPKKLAGVKVPKAVRRGFGDFLGSSAGKTVVAEIVLALSAVTLGSQARRGSPGREALSDVKDAGEHVAEASGDAAVRLKHAFTAAATAFRAALHEDPAQARLFDDVSEEGTKKKKSSPPAPSPTIAH